MLNDSNKNKKKPAVKYVRQWFSHFSYRLSCIKQILLVLFKYSFYLVEIFLPTTLLKNI